MPVNITIGSRNPDHILSGIISSENGPLTHILSFLPIGSQCLMQRVSASAYVALSESNRSLNLDLKEIKDSLKVDPMFVLDNAITLSDSILEKAVINYMNTSLTGESKSNLQQMIGLYYVTKKEPDKALSIAKSMSNGHPRNALLGKIGQCYLDLETPEPDKALSIAKSMFDGHLRNGLLEATGVLYLAQETPEPDKTLSIALMLKGNLRNELLGVTGFFYLAQETPEPDKAQGIARLMCKGSDKSDLLNELEKTQSV